MFTKSTFERRMQSYMAITILIGAFLTLWTGFMWLQNNPAIDIQPVVVEEVVYLEYMDSVVNHFEPVQLLSVFDVDLEDEEEEVLSEYDGPEDKGYDGVLVASTDREFITMQVVDGVKHFTNHLVG